MNKTTRLKIRLKVLLSIAIILFSSCKEKKKIMDKPIDYTNPNSWVSLPTAHKNVDVFYVYPTVYTAQSPENMNIKDPKLRSYASGLLKAQAGVYSQYANLFAPFYRQQSAAKQSMEANNGGRDAFANPYFKVGYQDVEQAFRYYLEHLNNGRPFILAGHSQGSMVLIELLRNVFDSTELQQQLIAAYAIGYTVTKKDLHDYPWMHLAKGEDDTGVIITYNTQGPNAGESPVLLNGAVSINPLNWKTNGTPAPRTLNIEAVFFDDATGKVIEKIPNFAGAYIDTLSGALIATDMQPINSNEIDLVNLGRWSKEVYHRYDYSFFYGNLKENVKKRIDSYLSK